MNPRSKVVLSWALGFLSWGLGGGASVVLDGRADLGSQALPLILAAALCSLWWPLWAATTACVLAATAFNWSFVTPRGTLSVTFERDVLLLVTMLAVSIGITLIMGRMRRLAVRERQQAGRLAELHALSERLRGADTPRAIGEALAEELQAPENSRCAVGLVAGGSSPGDRIDTVGVASADERSGLLLCAQTGRAMGPGTGYYENVAGWYLPLRGRSGSQGAAYVAYLSERLSDETLREHTQALCDLAGQALERQHAAAAAFAAQEHARTQDLRHTLLAAVSHDYRTPLASILGAASALQEQDARLSPEQRRRLSTTIVDEASHLGRLTENALQLTRLSASPHDITRDWESVEELVGAVLRRVRGRDPARRVRARFSGEMPLLRCDGVLITQLLENLVDNALKHGAADSPIEVLCRRMGERVLLAVRDRGPGIAPSERGRLLKAFERGDGARSAGIRGLGVGLALCEAVAQAHGSKLNVRARSHGGTSMELLLSLEPQPSALEGDASS